MADKFTNEGSSTSRISGEGSDATVELNIKTLDSQIFTFQVDKNMLVSAFKEKIANEIGVPVGQQRLIFRGKVLKDDHLLSEYQVENGHTLHLVARQPTQPQSSADTSSSDVHNGSRGNDASSGTPQSRIGQISHSVVLGTFNVGDSGEGTVPDLSRVIGAVLNSFGIGGQNSTSGIGGVQSSSMPNVSSQTVQGNETVGVSQSNSSGQSQAANQTEPGQAFSSQPFQSPPQVVQIPLTAAVPHPSLQLPLPDSLNTLSEFMTRMEQTLAQNGYQPNTFTNSNEEMPRPELSSNSRGLQALSIILRHAERLLNGHTTTALSHIAGCLEHDESSTDSSSRAQIQTEAMQVGLAMQHLGALFLELGRTILTLRMGQSPAEASVNPGPAVYISPSGPNPIMVQPFSLQNNSLFGGSAAQSNPMSFGPVGISNAPRNINIHITAGTSLAPLISTIGSRTSNGEGTQGERGNGTGSGPMRVLPVRNIIATAVPARSTGIAVTNASQPAIGVSTSEQTPDSTSVSSVISEVSSRLRNLVGGMQGENQPTSGSVDSGAVSNSRNEQPSGMIVDEAGESTVTVRGPMPEDDKKEQDDHIQGSHRKAEESFLSSKDGQSCSAGCSSVKASGKSEEISASSSSENHDLPEGARAAPLGLGMGSLDRKKRTNQPKSSVTSGETTSNTPASQNLSTAISGQQLLQSLASRSSSSNRVGLNDTQIGQLPSSGRSNSESRPLGQQGSDPQLDTASIMSQVMHSPALDGLLTGVSEQTGVGSPNVLRNMLQQLTQNPQIMSTVSQIAQQVENQDLGNMFSGLGNGQGGGIDISRMMQQMMPVVSQVLGRGSAGQHVSHVELESQTQHNESRLDANENADAQNVQIDLQEVAERVLTFTSPEDIFRTIAENAARSNGSDSRSEDIVNELSNNENLVSDYIEMLQRDINQRLQSEPRQE